MSLFLQRRKALSLAGCTLLLGAALAAAPLLADDQELPSPEEIVARYFEALGGEEAIRAHTSRTITGGFEMPAMGMAGDATIYAMAPDKMIMTTEVPGFGENHRMIHGLRGSNLTDHDDVRCLTQGIFECDLETRRIHTDRALGHHTARMLVNEFNRVLNGNDVPFRVLVSVADHGRKGC